MCVAVPIPLIAREEDLGVAEPHGIRREVALALVPEARPGDYVLVHAGIAIERLRPEEAEETLLLLRAATGEMG